MASKFGTEKPRDYTRPTGRLPQFWSFSRYADWCKCPGMYAFRHVYKLRGPDNRAMQRGSDIHKKSENYLLGTIKGIPKELMQFRQEYAAVRKLKAVPELSYTATKSWQPTFATDWDNAWVRAKVDIEIPPHGVSFNKDVLTVVDVKTGKKYPEHEDQADIYGVLGFIIHPKIDTIDFEYWYLDSGDSTSVTFHREGLRDRKQEWKSKVRPMLSARTFKTTPSKAACKYCNYRSDKKLSGGEDGPCHAWKQA